MEQKECEFCARSGYTYNQHCDTCIARKIENLRSPDHRLSRKLQMEVFAGLHKERAEEVKRILTERKNAS